MATRRFLLRHFFQVKELKELTDNTRQYRRKLRALKAKAGPILVQDLRNGLVETDALPIRRAHRRWLATCFSSIAVTVVSILMCLILGGNRDLEDIPQPAATYFIISLITMCGSVLFGMFSALWAGRYVTQYLVHLIDQFDTDTHGLSEEQVQTLIEAGEEHGPIEQSERCGCYHCLEVYSSPAHVDEYDDAVCPSCGHDTVIHESSGYPVDEEFLHQMQHFWIGRDGEKP